MNMSENINEIAEALAQFQAVVPTINKSRVAKISIKKKDGDYGSMSLKYADIADVLKSIRESLSKCGLSVAQFAETSDVVLNGVVDKSISVTTLLMHKSGQWLKSTISENLSANKGKMTSVQAIGSLTTYLRRYGLASMLGLATDDDTDGHIGNEYVSNAQIEREETQLWVENNLKNIKNADSQAWIDNYVKKNRSLECMKKAKNIVSWETSIDSMIAETVNMIQYLDEDNAVKADSLIAKINNSRVENIENGQNYYKAESARKWVRDKVEEMNA